MTEVARLCALVADLQDELKAAKERISDLEEQLEDARRPWRGPDRKARLERGWTPSR